MTMLSPLPVTSFPNKTLEFDFPSLRIGCAEYQTGPTGTTVFHFPDRVIAAVDVRGGAPGTYNVDSLRLGYDFRHLDAIVFSGGSWYGLAAAAGVAGAMKADRRRSGQWGDIANVAGAIIYDYGARRPTDNHPDAALGAAAFEAARTGSFPLGPCGAGRCTMQGAYFGLALHSGQGGAFRQIGPTKIAAFVIANPVGVITSRDGSIVTNSEDPPSGVSHVSELLARLPLNRDIYGLPVAGQHSVSTLNPANTTISLVVTNQTLSFAETQRLAIQVHASMGRAIQPYSSALDGDVLFAASTQEVANNALHASDLGTIAGEVMWDALESALTVRPVAAIEARPIDPEAIGGIYHFAQDVALRVTASDRTIGLEALGPRGILGFAPGNLVSTACASDGFFAVRDPSAGMLSTGRFYRSDTGTISLALNPGQWQQVTTKQ